MTDTGMGDELRAALEYARRETKQAQDLLMERIEGNPARSPSHNARLVLEYVIRKIDAALVLPVPVAGETDAEKDKLASRLYVAWVNYVRLFGEPPHGTEKQLRALSRLIPTLATERVSDQESETALDRAEALLRRPHGPSSPALPEKAVAWREALADIQSHHEVWKQALEASRDHALRCNDPDDAAYWRHEISVLDRINRVALTASPSDAAVTGLTIEQRLQAVRATAIEECANKVVFCGECDCPNLSQYAIRALQSSKETL